MAKKENPGGNRGPQMKLSQTSRHIVVPRAPEVWAEPDGSAAMSTKLLLAEQLGDEAYNREQENAENTREPLPASSLDRFKAFPSSLVTPGDGFILNESVLARLGAEWGIDIGRGGQCPLPEHTGWADLVCEGGEWRLRCCEGRSRSIAEVVAARAYGSDRRLTNAELLIWWRLTAYVLDCFEPVEVDVPDPPTLGEGAARLRDGFALLVGLRRVEPRGGMLANDEVPYTVEFARAWTGLPTRAARDGLAELRNAGVIVVARMHGRMPLYVPGDGVPLASPEEAEVARLGRKWP